MRCFKQKKDKALKHIKPTKPKGISFFLGFLLVVRGNNLQY